MLSQGEGEKGENNEGNYVYLQMINFSAIMGPWNNVVIFSVVNRAREKHCENFTIPDNVIQKFHKWHNDIGIICSLKILQ